MKQTLFLVAISCYCAFRSLFDPFWAVLLYYGLAVLRPQAIWQWSLPEGVRWSLYAAILAVAATALNFSSVRSLVQRTFVWLLLGYCLLLVCSYVFAIDHEIAGKYGWEYVKIFVMLFVACYVVNRRWHFRYLGLCIFACLAYLVYEVNALYLFDHRLDIYHSGYGGLDNNGAGLMLVMAVPFCYHLFLAEKRWWRWGYVACVIPTAHAVMLTYSRGAMLSGAVCGIGMVLTASRKRLRAVAALAVLGALVLSLAGKEVQDRFLTIKQEDRDTSQQSRLDSWRAGLKIARDYPLFGAGIRCSNLLTKQYGADMEGRTIHNVYIQIMADSGFPAGGVYILLVAWSLKWLRIGARRSDGRLEEVEARWHHHLCKAAFWSLATFAFGSFFLSLEQVELPYLLFLMGGVASGLSDMRSKAPGAASKGAPAPVALNR